MGRLSLLLGVATLLVVAVENAGGAHYALWDLGTLGTGTASYAYGVNDSGEVAGYAYTTAGNGSPHAVLYSNGTLTDISASWSNPLARATAINDSGLVVGYLNGSPLHGFMYNGSTDDRHVHAAGGTQWSYQSGVCRHFHRDHCRRRGE